MQLPATRIRFARAVAAELAGIDKASAGTLAAEAVRLIREIQCSPELAARIASARAMTIYTSEDRRNADHV